MSKQLRTDAAAALAPADLAAATLGHLASNPDRLMAFFDATGLRPADLRAGAADGSLDRALLHHLMLDESLLMAVATSLGVQPEAVATAALTKGGAATACRAASEES